MCFGEPADHMRFSIGLRSAVFNLMKILEEVPKQIRIAGASLCQGSVDNIRRVLRKGEFRTLDFAQERAETGTRRFEALTYGSINFLPTEGAIRDNTGSGRLGQVHRHLEIRRELEHVHLPAVFAAFQRTFLENGQGISPLG